MILIKWSVCFYLPCRTLSPRRASCHRGNDVSSGTRYRFAFETVVTREPREVISRKPAGGKVIECGVQRAATDEFLKGLVPSRRERCSRLVVYTETHRRTRSPTVPWKTKEMAHGTTPANPRTRYFAVIRLPAAALHSVYPRQIPLDTILSLLYTPSCRHPAGF